MTWYMYYGEISKSMDPGSAGSILVITPGLACKASHIRHTKQTTTTTHFWHGSPTLDKVTTVSFVLPRPRTRGPNLTNGTLCRQGTAVSSLLISKYTKYAVL